MQKHIRITLAQLNFLLGDIVGNTEKIIASAIKARDEQQSDLIIFSELSLTGYPPEDLLLRSELYQYVRDALEKIKTTVKGITVIVGHPTQTETGRYNAASVIQDGKIIDTYHKYHLPNYSVFDEKRYFISGEKPCVFSIKNIPVGITICEDLWQPGPLKQAVDAGAKLMLCLNASPFHHNKVFQREQILQHRQQEEGKIPIVYVNCVGGQDELIFDGYSTVLDAEGKVKLRAPAYEECLLPIDFEFTKNKTIETISGFISEPLSDEASLYQALVLGTRDYIQKNHFKGALIGLSGGIDSALTLAIAVDAIGADKIHGLLMPSRYTAEMSIEDAVAEANALGVKYSILSIEK
ncbi:MAG: NAD+ synthase, partial [Proteobacteria bacterium]|nr:NAD+ synthase [Pseudomonadota bacterium]